MSNILLCPYCVESGSRCRCARVVTGTGLFVTVVVISCCLTIQCTNARALAVRSRVQARKIQL
jgi:hypothetical protein